MAVNSDENNEETVSAVLTTTQDNDKKEIILATALVKLQNGNNSEILRALIDPGSQKSYLTKSVAEKLQLSLEHEKNRFSGLGNNKTTTTYSKANVMLRPRYPSPFCMETKVLTRNITYQTK